MTWDEVIEAGLRYCGLTPEQFWDLSFREFDLLLLHESDKREDAYNRVRMLGVWTLSPHTKKRIKPKDLLILPSDKAPRASTWEEFQQAIERSRGTDRRT